MGRVEVDEVEIRISGIGDYRAIDDIVDDFLKKLGFKFIWTDPDIPLVKTGFTEFQGVFSYYRRDTKLYELRGSYRLYGNTFEFEGRVEYVDPKEMSKAEKEHLKSVLKDYGDDEDFEALQHYFF